MKRITITLCTALFLYACNDEKTETTDVKEDTDTTTTSTSTMASNEAKPDSATAMKNWQTYMTPSDVHKMISSWSGTWTGEVTMWHAPGMPPEKSTSTTQNKMVMGGRYQVSNHKGNMMGMPFEGMSTVAYDNAKKVFINTWIDNMGSGMMVMEGPWDEASKTLTLKGKGVDPTTGNGKEIEMRETFKIIDDNTQMMESWSGTWDGDVTMWHAPGAPPEKSKSTSQNKMVMGGRYQISNHTGNMMGMPFEGMSTVAYDNARKVFINTWIDNMGSGMMVMEGPWDAASKTMTLKGKVVDPTAGNGKEMEIRETFKIIDDNTQMMEMFGLGPDGKEFKMMEIKYTRKK